MNIKNIIRNAIRDCITEEAVTNAVEHILDHDFDMEDYLSDSDWLKDLVSGEIDDALMEMFVDQF